MSDDQRVSRNAREPEKTGPAGAERWAAYLDWLREDLEMGYERVYVHNVARDHLERFINAWAERVLPAVA